MSLVVIAPVPPPTTGRSVVTAQLVEHIKQTATPFLLVNLAVRWTIGPFRRRLRRLLHLMRFAGQVLRRIRQAVITYIAVDSSPGTLFTALYALTARAAATRIILHHHSYSYIERSTFSMRCLSWTAGPGALHVTPCAVVSAELSARYSGVERTAVLTNAFAIDPALTEVRRPAERDQLVLGHLSNLTVAKGVLTVVACFAELRRRGEPVELHLAGPIQDETVGRAISNAKVEHGEAFHHHGPLDAAGKRAFYEAIDVFLFPTRFRNEVQPLVVLEALAAAVPTVAFGRACIPALLEGDAGVVVPCDAEFTSAAVAQIVAWRSDRAALAAAGEAARARFGQLQRQSLEELAALLGELVSGPRVQRSPPAPANEPGSVKPILFVGPLPPPVTGRTVTTAEIVHRLDEQQVPLRLINTAPASSGASWLQRLSRAARSLKACGVTLTASRGVRFAYIAVDADLGMHLTTLNALSARLRGKRILLHHHNYSYVARKGFRMSLLAFAAGPEALHLAVCCAMADELKSRYPRVLTTLVLSNVISVRAMQPVARAAIGPLVLGHLSNLSFDKGVATVISCLRRLRREGVDARLMLAGPAQNKRVVQLLRDAVVEFGGAFEHLGPLYDDAKRNFFRDIDVFLFPTRYRNETQGIVNLEAMAAGAPVIAYGQCCIPGDLENSGGLVVPCGAEFESVAVPQLARWARDRDLLRQASATARQRFEQLRAQGERDLDVVMTVLSGEWIVKATRPCRPSDPADADEDRRGERPPGEPPSAPSPLVCRSSG